MAIDDTTSLALAGNLYLAQRISKFRNPRFLSTVDYLRNSEVAITNLECCLPDPGTPPAFVAGQGWATTYMTGSEGLVDDLRFLGIDMIGAANNHVSDFGDAGILATARKLSSAGLLFSGLGPSLKEATQAAFFDAPSGLRFALISVCDWGPRGAQSLNSPWPMGVIASDETRPFHSRPGISLLRYETVCHITGEQFSALRQISSELGWNRDKVYRKNGFWRSHPLAGMTTNLEVEDDNDDTIWFLGRRFVLDRAPGQHTEACKEDVERIAAAVREASKQADVVIVALHDQSHGEHGLHGYIETFAHAMIDAGADIYLNNGGTFRGVTVYRDKPIFQGLPSFFLQTEAVVAVPDSEKIRYGLPANASAADFIDIRAQRADKARKEGGELSASFIGAGGSAIHSCKFDGDSRLIEIRIQPLEPLGGTKWAIDKGTKVPNFRRQLPLIPSEGSEVQNRLLSYIVQQSAESGTELEIDSGQAVLRL